MGFISGSGVVDRFEFRLVGCGVGVAVLLFGIFLFVGSVLLGSRIRFRCGWCCLGSVFLVVVRIV